MPADTVAYADALMYPFPTAPLIHNSDQKAFFDLEEKLLARYYKESGVAARPTTLDQYMAQLVPDWFFSAQNGPAPNSGALIALLEKIGPAVVLAHSQGGLSCDQRRLDVGTSLD